jgi:predicted anti-sigma-YlaC factor YlaD
MSAMRGPLSFLNGHLGAAVSALVDGQLDAESTDRAWQHVGTCASCRQLVEREGWLKRQLASINETPQAGRPSEALMGNLLDLDAVAASWADADEIDTRGRGRRRAGLVLVGAGSVSAAVLGLTTLTGAPLGLGGGPGNARPATSIGDATSTPTPTRAVVAPTTPVRGRLPGWTLTTGDAGVARARAIDARR